MPSAWASLNAPREIRSVSAKRFQHAAKSMRSVCTDVQPWMVAPTVKMVAKLTGVCISGPQVCKRDGLAPKINLILMSSPGLARGLVGNLGPAMHRDINKHFLQRPRGAIEARQDTEGLLISIVVEPRLPDKTPIAAQNRF